jgi:hypothetical protein
VDKGTLNLFAGVPSLFSQEEESFLVEHVKTMAEIGYGLTRAEVVNLATDYAVSLHLREKGKVPFSSTL